MLNLFRFFFKKEIFDIDNKYFLGNMHYNFGTDIRKYFARKHLIKKIDFLFFCNGKKKLMSMITSSPWIPKEKGIYDPPPIEKFPNVQCRTIKISDYIAKNISHFIGKDGKNFVDWTNDFGVLYVFYRNQEIEIWGEDTIAIHKLIHFIIEKIKRVNRSRQQRFELLKKKNDIPADQQCVSNNC